MQWLPYAIAAALVVGAARMWVGYLDRMTALREQDRTLRRNIQQALLAIEERERRETEAIPIVEDLEAEEEILRAELDAANALLDEMIRREGRRNPEVEAMSAEWHTPGGGRP